MEFSLNRYYCLNRLLLSTIGLWPYQSGTNVWIRRMFATLIMMWASFGQIIKICASELTADFILDVLPILIPNIAVLIQFITRIMDNSKMRDLLDRIKIDWERTRSQDEIKIMQTYATYARITTILFSFYVVIGISTYIFITLLPQILDVFLPLNESRSRQHPFHIEFFMDEEKYFYVVRFQMYFIIILVLGIVLANATIFIVYIQHVSGMFAVLGNRAERLFSNDMHSRNARSIRGTGKGHRNIVLFVEDHRNVIQFVDIVQSCYNFSLFLELLTLIILIGLTLLQIIKFPGITDRSSRSVLFVGGQLIYLFLCSYMGQRLIDTSAQMSTKIYFGKWYNMSVWKQKIMLFIMMRCMRTISISPYNMCVVSLENFSMIIQSSLSVLMVLRRI